MSDIIKYNERTPVPDKERNEHVPSSGDIYYDSSPTYPRIYKIKEIQNSDWCLVNTFDLDSGTWDREDKRVSLESLHEYFRLLIGDFAEIWATAFSANNGDERQIRALFNRSKTDEESLALVASRPAEQILALTEESERLQDKLQTINDMMSIQITHMMNVMRNKLAGFNKELSRINDYVKDLHRIITVMNLYTGANVDITVICDGQPASASEPIHVRQRILFMDEEFLADAENGGIDCEDIGRFCEWLKEPENRDIICPEQKCIVAMKPKRYDKYYAENYWDNKAANKWNHHTIVFFRDGERLLMVDSEDLELFETAIPWSDQNDRFEKEYEKIMGERSFQESNLKYLNEKSKRLGYMYTKYISFLQGMVDSGKIFNLAHGRPNFAKEEGVVYLHDEENVIGTGENWQDFHQKVNEKIRRGTRIIFFPYTQDSNGYSVSPGEPNREYYYDCNRPKPPQKGLYNVDYPKKTVWEKNPETGRLGSVQKTGTRLAIFYKPQRWWTDSEPRAEAWLYNEKCVLNYDLLTVEDIDRFMADRTQRKSFRLWMPVLMEARKQLLEEKKDEEGFIMLMGKTLMKEHPEICLDCIRSLIEESVTWWKEKVIFTRPLRSDDAKAWRMIYKRCISQWNKND